MGDMVGDIAHVAEGGLAIHRAEDGGEPDRISRQPIELGIPPGQQLAAVFGDVVEGLGADIAILRQGKGLASCCGTASA